MENHQVGIKEQIVTERMRMVRGATFLSSITTMLEEKTLQPVQDKSDFNENGEHTPFGLFEHGDIEDDYVY